MDHKEKNAEARKRRNKSKRAHLRQLQKVYELTRDRVHRLEKELERLQMELFSTKYNIK
jgi:chromosome segregation ATPase